MLNVQTIEVAGQRFVLLEAGEYERLCSRAGEAVQLTDDDLPALPKPDKNGRFPALEYARISLARDLVRERKAAGLSQVELAKRAGIRPETLSRIEHGRLSVSPKTVQRIEAALKAAPKTKRQLGR